MAAVCRACTCLIFNTDEIVPLFEPFRNVHNLTDILSNSLHATVDFTDEITKYVCRLCADKIIDVHHFHQMYLESETKLRELMKTDLKSTEDEVNNLFDSILSDATNFDIPLEWECATCLEKFYDQNVMDIHKRNCCGAPTELIAVNESFQLTYFDDAQVAAIAAETPPPSNIIHTAKDAIDATYLDDILQIENALIQPNNVDDVPYADPVGSQSVTFRYKCVKCGTEFDSSHLLLDHDAICNISYAICISSTTVATEIPLTPSSPSGPPFLLPLSSLSSQSLPSVQTAINYDHNNNNCIDVPKNWICKKCGDAFDSKDSLNEHKYSTHRDPNKVYKFPQNYHRNDAGEFVCDFCGKGFATRSKVNGHIRNHTGEKALCNMCGKSFSSRNNLTKHHRTVHLKEKNYQCSVCEKRYDSSYRLKIHSNRHEGIRQFECKYCTNRFMTTSALTRHQKTVHSDEKKHVCPICSKGFKVAENLRAHMTTHTGHRQHICVHCGAEYTRKSKLEMHIEESHGVIF